MRSYRILVVEDDATLAELLRCMLEGRGHRVRVAYDGRQGADQAHAWLPDLVLMDLHMPVMDGLASAAAIRQHPATRWVPIMATTALDDPGDLLRAMMAGFNRYIRKPFREEQLFAEIEDLMLTSERRRRLAALALTPAQAQTQVTLDRDRQQILRELLVTLQRRVHCDFFAVGWTRPAKSGLVLVVAGETASCELVDALEQWVWGEGRDELRPERLVVTASPAASAGAETASAEQGPRAAAASPLEQSVASLVHVPLLVSSESSGLLLVGSFSTHDYDAAELEAIDAFSQEVARVWQHDVTVAGQLLQANADDSIDALIGEIDVAVVGPVDQARRWAEAISCAIGGVRLSAVADSESLVETVDPPLLALVDPRLMPAVEEVANRRARAGRRVLPAIALEPALLEGPERRMGAFVMMSLLLALMDGGRSGCLHVEQRGGGPAGMMVFQRGRVAWAISLASGVSLLKIISEVCGINPEQLRSVVRRSVAARERLQQVLVAEGLVSVPSYSAALKTYLTASVGHLLQVPHPDLLWSREIRVAPTDLTFDGTEIVMSSVFA
ncbi:MAG: response regulator [Proteobacteria bacterium]|nr:response regulator [Pseudomonadota bacterium]